MTNGTEGEKSATQSVTDTLSGNSKPGEKGVVEQVTDTVNAGVKYVQDTATGTSDPFAKTC